MRAGQEDELGVGKKTQKATFCHEKRPNPKS